MLYDVKVNGKIVGQHVLAPNLSKTALREIMRQLANSLLPTRHQYVIVEKLNNSEKYLVMSSQRGRLLFSLELRMNFFQRFLRRFK